MYQKDNFNLPIGGITETSETREMVAIKLPQGFDTNINIRFVAGRDIAFTPAVFGCQPRQGASRRESQPVALPEGLAEKLKDANKKVIDWLARDPANASLFLARPVEALNKAGVDLTRAEQKALERTHSAVQEMAIVAPGVKVNQMSASANPKGRVGDFDKSNKPKGKREEEAGCVSEGKE